MYEQSLNEPEKFWGEQGKRLHWMKPYTRVKNTSFTGDVNIRWYADGTLNACQNCVDRHLPARADQAAILWRATARMAILNSGFVKNFCLALGPPKKTGFF
jgi:acetyl-CoA synthetase